MKLKILLLLLFVMTFSYGQTKKELKLIKLRLQADSASLAMDVNHKTKKINELMVLLTELSDSIHNLSESNKKLSDSIYELKSDEIYFNKELRKWKKKLEDEKVVGSPFIEPYDIQNWTKINPGVSYSFEDVKSYKFDFNYDNLTDCLFVMSTYYPEAQGKVRSPNFALLIYSLNGEYFKHNNILQEINQEVLKEFKKIFIEIMGAQPDIWRFETDYIKDFDENGIAGVFHSWTQEDPLNYPSLTGWYNYSPVSQKVNIYLSLSYMMSYLKSFGRN